MPPPNGGAPIPGTMGQPSVDPMTGAPLPPGGPGGAVDPATGMPMDPAASGGAPPGGAAPPPPAPTQPDPKTGQPSTSPMQDPPPLPLPSNPRMTPPRPRPTMKDMTQQGTMHSLMQDKQLADVPMNNSEATEDMKSQAMAMGSKTATDKYRLMAELGTASAMLSKSAFWTSPDDLEKDAGFAARFAPWLIGAAELTGVGANMAGMQNDDMLGKRPVTEQRVPAPAPRVAPPPGPPKIPQGPMVKNFRVPKGGKMALLGGFGALGLGSLMKQAGIDQFTVPIGYPEIEMSRTIHDGPPSWMKGVPGYKYVEPPRPFGSPDPNAATGEYKPTGQNSTATNTKTVPQGPRVPTGQTTQLYRPIRPGMGQRLGQLMGRAPGGRAGLLMGGLGLLGGVGASQIPRLFQKKGSQADDGNKDTAKSATGESKGLKYQYKADHHAQGQEAWESVSMYFKGHGKRGKNQPNPSLGKHADDALKALLGMETSQLDIPAHTLPPPLAAQLNPDTPRDVPGVNLGIPILAGLSGLGLGYAAGHRSGKKKEKEKKAEYAELTPFARGFFEQCDLAGVDHSKAVEKVGADFGEEAIAELRDGLTKLAGWRDRLATGGMKLLGWGEQGATKAAPSTFGATRGQLGNLSNQFGRNPMLQQGMQSANAADQAAARSLAREQAANYMRTNPNAARFWGSGFGNATYNAGQRIGQAGQYMAPVGRQLAPSAGGALMGGFAGDSMGMGGDSLEILPGIKLNYRGMAAGAAASNPFLRRRANSFAGGTLSMPMAGMRAAGVGSMGGGAFDQLAGAAGYDTGGAGARLGAWGGFGLGAARQGVRLAPNWMGGTNSGLSRLNTTLGQAERGMGNFTNESFKGFFKPLTYPFRAGANYLRGAPQTGVMGGAAKGAAGRFGRMVGVGTLGLTGIGTGYGMLRDKITGDAREAIGQTAAELMPEVQDQAAGFMDQYMMSRGMMDETGQFNPMMAANRQGGIMGGIMRGSDDIFRSLGMDPSRMSPLQKLMILGGSAAAGGGALAGAPALAGVGGVSALAGLLPQLMPSQSQQVMGNGAQAPYRPGQPQGQQAGVPGVNQFGPQGPQARNEWQMFQQPQQPGVGG